MGKAVSGQLFLIICCIFYLIWWYRGYNPAAPADRVGGVNGMLLSITTMTGMVGLILTLMPIKHTVPLRFNQMLAVLIGIAAYIILMIVTKYGFNIMSVVIAMAFVISMVLYVAYYRMDETKAFYAAMVPLVTEGVSMGILVAMMIL